MKPTKREFAEGTELVTVGPWDLYQSARALCPDGVVRHVRLSPTPDTWFSIPGRTQARGKTVAGYVTVSEITVGSVEKSVVEFRPYLYRKNHAAVCPPAEQEV